MTAQISGLHLSASLGRIKNKTIFRGKSMPGSNRATSLPMVMAVLLGMGGLAGCAAKPPMSHIVPAGAVAATMPSPVVSMKRQSLPPDARLPLTPYRLGPNDVIAVSVYLHPELSTPQYGVTSGPAGALITSDGTVGLPLIGTVKLAGLTVSQAQAKLQAAYSAYVNNANISVQLVTPHSLRYYLLGDFSSPGIKYPGRELTLLEALSLGGSLNVANADLYQAYVAVGARKEPVDLRELLLDGNLSQNIVLPPGATIVIPPASEEKAFVFGAVGKPGAIGFQGGSLSLLQAMSEAGMTLSNYTDAQLSQIRIIRSHGASADFIVVNARKIMDGHAMPFALQPGDIVFVPPTGIATWNDVLNKLLPSLNTISGVLNPFVSIKYLSK
ncbi:polysaccharide biosynthesis/export family protein [Acidocella sp. C78]|uniref:polysaccharide biosynthesis/export family protein n=1 Tax=Acidocella sp. C78 TaxID=1671486 RepID=UPI00191BBA59|nr:polysaccharide biosynthesis/export family protein [Acidocella sp. C78]